MGHTHRQDRVAAHEADEEGTEVVDQFFEEGAVVGGVVHHEKRSHTKEEVFSGQVRRKVLQYSAIMRLKTYLMAGVLVAATLLLGLWLWVRGTALPTGLSPTTPQEVLERLRAGGHAFEGQEVLEGDGVRGFRGPGFYLKRSGDPRSFADLAAWRVGEEPRGFVVITRGDELLRDLQPGDQVVGEDLIVRGDPEVALEVKRALRR